MSEQALAGVVLVAVPILFNAGFTLLARRFDYPDVLRRPTHEVLERFRAGGTSLILIWWLFALAAVLFRRSRSCLQSPSTTRIARWLCWVRSSGSSPRWFSSLA